MSVTQWQIGQEVDVAPRTWPGINKPGGVGKIIKIHFSSLGVVDSLDVKYVLGNNTDTNLEPDLVKPHIELDRGRRSRKGRDFFTVAPTSVEGTKKQTTSKKITEDNKENDNTETPSLVGKKRKENTSKISKNETKHKKKNIKSDTATSKSKKSDRPTKQNKPAQRTKSTEKEESEKRDGTIPESIPKFIVTTGAATANPLSPLSAHIRDEVPHIGSHFGNSSKQANKKKKETKPKIISRAAATSFLTSVPLNQPPPDVARKSLKNVYEDQVQEASNYINDLVGCGTKETGCATKESFDSSSLLHQKTDGQRQEEERCQQFGKHFSRVMTRHDMTLPEEELVEAINSSIQADQACKAFTVDEVDRFVSRLCAEEKVMKSDGFYYAI